MASEEGHHDVVLTLLGAGADVNIARSDVSDVMFYNCTVKCVQTKGYHFSIFGNSRK